LGLRPTTLGWRTEMGAVEYKTVYRPYVTKTLISQRDEDRSRDVGVNEDFDKVLNEHEDGWRVKDCGVINTQTHSIFWALLEREAPSTASFQPNYPIRTSRTS